MVALGMCIGCKFGSHENHQRIIQVVPEGMLGGSVCRCEGDCEGNVPEEFHDVVHLIYRAIHGKVKP